MTRTARRWPGKWIAGGILLPLALGIVPGVPHPFLNLFLWWVRPPPRAEVPAPLPAVDRVLVIAPHPDDEALALGGTIAQLRADGQQVLVVFLTNGDANRAAKNLFTLNPLRRPEDYRALGYRRQKEAVAALRILGVPTECVLFLGYPDRGLAALTRTNWARDAPYTSPFTKANHTFYRNSFTPGAPYCGESVVADLALILRRFSPTVVYFPHPEDGHPDHRAAVPLVLAALSKVEWSQEPELRLYVVHAPNWPSPRRLAVGRGIPIPTNLESWTWVSHELTPQLVETKLRAIRAYSSQRVTNGRFLASFVRSSELYTPFSAPRLTLPVPGT